MTKTETYEEWAKALFIKEPANMKLLVVVDKLLNGFDRPPPCTYLYIDKSMQDHGLSRQSAVSTGWTARTRLRLHRRLQRNCSKKGRERHRGFIPPSWIQPPGGVDPEVLLLKDHSRKGKNA